jgi:hypothetical protein
MVIATLPPRFLNWRMSDGRKVPCRPDGRICDAHDPVNWNTHDVAAAAPYEVAWVLNGDGWFFLDLDKCRDADGTWSQQAAAVWASFAGALGEVSQSQHGLHILGRCDPAALADRRNKWDGWLEFYTTGRFIAFGPGGWDVIGGGQQTDRDFTDQLRSFVPRREELGVLPEGRDPSYTGPESDDRLIEIMLRSTSVAGAFGEGVTIKHLWEADAAALSRVYPAFQGEGFDHSSADAALMSHLAFWTGKDMPRMDRLFRRSALMRDKYEKREDYRRDTVQKSARLCKRVYDVPQSNAPSDAPPPPEEYLSIPEMQAHFKGCVYVLDAHRIMIPDGRLLKPEQFNAKYGGHQFQMLADGRRPTRKAFEAFTENTLHRFPQVNTTCFRPDQPTGAVINEEVNIYVPADVRRVKGDPSRFLAFLEKLIPDERDRCVLMSWCCGVAQNIGKKPMWAPVLQGTEGNGKSMIGEILGYALGERYVHRARSKELGSQFNGWMEGKLLIMPDEIHMDGRRQALDDLKPFLTNVMVPVRHMHQTEANKYCPTAWFFTTQHKDAVIKSRQDRRYAIFFTAQQTRADLDRDFPEGFFPALWDWLRDEDGFAIMAEWLMTTPPDDRFNPFGSCTVAPTTSSSNEATAATMGPIEAEIQEAIDAGILGFRGGWISTWALSNLLRNANLRVSRPKLSQILQEMGYVSMGRATRPLPLEDGQKPVLWALAGTVGNADEYLASQGPGSDW